MLLIHAVDDGRDGRDRDVWCGPGSLRLEALEFSLSEGDALDCVSARCANALSIRRRTTCAGTRSSSLAIASIIGLTRFGIRTAQVSDRFMLNLTIDGDMKTKRPPGRTAFVLSRAQ